MEESITILVAEDDPDDRLLIGRALDLGIRSKELRMVEDGAALLDYLYRRGTYAAAGKAPRPRLILLDLNMPRLSGREALRSIKDDPALRSIPVVVFTTSDADFDVRACYDIGANAFITKPLVFHDLMRIARAIDAFWFTTATLPPV